MSEITVTTVTPQDWAAFKAVRLDALRDSPAAFSATLAEEAAFSDQEWIARVEWPLGSLRTATVPSSAPRASGSTRPTTRPTTGSPKGSTPD